MAYSIARGGKLYDKWFEENETEAPSNANPAYPASGKYRGKKGADWRCKECHGWDYRGKDGAYKKGKHATGTPGLRGVEGMSNKEIISRIMGGSHRYGASMLSLNDLLDLADFLASGQVDVSSFIDDETKLAEGNVNHGEALYQTVCTGCHALDGKGEKTPPLGELARKNPWEVLHKIRFGQPNEVMPGLHVLGVNPAVDILAYLQKSLP